MKQFPDGSNPKDTYQPNMNLMMEKSNSENLIGVKGIHRSILEVDRRH